MASPSYESEEKLTLTTIRKALPVGDKTEVIVNEDKTINGTQ